MGHEFFQQKETKITKAKEERDIGEVSTLTVKRTLYLRLPQADPYDYEAEDFKEKDPTTGEAFARRPEEAGQDETKVTGSGGNKSGEIQKESSCPCGCQAFQASRSQEIAGR